MVNQPVESGSNAGVGSNTAIAVGASADSTYHEVAPRNLYLWCVGYLMQHRANDGNAFLNRSPCAAFLLDNDELTLASALLDIL